MASLFLWILGWSWYPSQCPTLGSPMLHFFKRSFLSVPNFLVFSLKLRGDPRGQKNVNLNRRESTKVNISLNTMYTMNSVGPVFYHVSQFPSWDITAPQRGAASLHGSPESDLVPLWTASSWRRVICVRPVLQHPLIHAPLLLSVRLWEMQGC